MHLSVECLLEADRTYQSGILPGGRDVYTGGNGSSCFQAELGGGDKIPPPSAAFRILPRLNIMRKEIIKK